MATRRKILGSVAALATVPVAVQAAPASSSPIDPLVVLYQKYLDLMHEHQAIDDRHDALDRVLVQKLGKRRWEAGRDLWKDDPQFPEWTRLMEESDASLNRAVAVQDAVLDGHPTSAAGLRAKVLVALELMPPELDEWHDKVNHRVLREVALWLGGSTEPVTGRS